MQLASKNNRVAVGLLIVSTGLVAAFASCTDSYDKNLPSSSSGHPSGAGSGSGAGGSIIIPDGGGCYDTCSNDLQTVVDCFGKVKVQCTPDQGCVNASCQPGPCMAADKSKSSYGCNYWALKTAQRTQADGACFAAVIANTWTKPVHLKVDRGGANFLPEMFTYIPDVKGQTVTYKPYDPVAGIDIGQVAILFLSRGNGPLLKCPVPAGSNPAVVAETGVVGTGRGTAFHISSDYPVVAYQIDPYGGALTSYASATLLLPVSAWDQDYIAISAYKSSPIVTGGDPSLNILAYKDNTDVIVTPNVDITAGMNVVGATAGQKVTYTLNAGEFLQITQPAELTGSSIYGTNAIGVFGAHTCMTVPGMQSDCDNAQQQIAPFTALGNEYVAVRYKNRVAGQEEAPPWRVVGAAKGTMLSWEPTRPPGAPTDLNIGDVMEFSAPGPFVVKSQDSDHPFYIGGYMTGGQPFMDIGDPEWVNVVPSGQYLNHYVLFTDPTYPETSLVVVRTRSKQAPKGFADVKLKCSGVDMPLTGWQPVGKSDGNYEYTRVDLVTGDFMSVGGCSNGRQEMSSDQLFGVTVWGWGTTVQTTQVSYAYPAGEGFQPINTATPPPH